MDTRKPYFAQWLPVEGEIQQGDWYLHFTHGMYSHRHKEWVGRNWDVRQHVGATVDKMYALAPEGYRFRAHLFLCTYAIQPGDKLIVLLHDEGYIREFPHPGDKASLPDDCFKKIKKISPDAVWVKGGEEFEEEDISPYNELIEVPIDRRYMDEQDPGVISYIRIYNHSCKHFH